MLNADERRPHPLPGCRDENSNPGSPDSEDSALPLGHCLSVTIRLTQDWYSEFCLSTFWKSNHIPQLSTTKLIRFKWKCRETCKELWCFSEFRLDQFLWRSFHRESARMTNSRPVSWSLERVSHLQRIKSNESISKTEFEVYHFVSYNIGYNSMFFVPMLFSVNFRYLLGRGNSPQNPKIPHRN